MARFARTLARRPGTVARRAVSLGAELGNVAVGASEYAPYLLDIFSMQS
jgi:hypothetical protein